MKSMAASVTNSYPVSESIPAASATWSAANPRRYITPEAGHALEKLGHAIEYLTDEFVHEGGSLCARDSRIEAVQLLMALNRKVYFECPPVRTLGERCRSWLGLDA